MFVDSVEICIFSGNGGAGASSFRREKFVIHGGPDGGDGGDGGDIIFKTKANINTLSTFRAKKHYRAKNGLNGGAKNSNGKKGEDLIIYVPVGTQVINTQSGELVCDLKKEDENFIVLRGGKGGLGNTNFKSARNQTPQYAQKGLSGESMKVRLELKLIADIGLVGFPNVGKSSLIASISNAKPEIANYEFTTITPHLGVVEVGEFDSFIIADIPGIIEGASKGKGLGIRFLQHIERAKFLLYVLDCTKEAHFIESSPDSMNDSSNLSTQFQKLRQEIENFDALHHTKIAEKPFAIGISKIDMLKCEHTQSKEKELDKYFKKTNLKPKFTLVFSAITRTNLEKLKFALFNALNGFNNK